MINERKNLLFPRTPDTAKSGFNQNLLNWLKPSDIKGHQESLYLINTRLWIKGLSEKYHRRITIDTVPENEWLPLLQKYDTFWFMGIYIPSSYSQNHARKYTDQYRYALPDINSKKDVVASPFAIPDYIPNPQIVESWPKWDRMVESLHRFGKKVIIDFVPNHTGPEHRWTKDHPEYYIQGTKEQYQKNPNFYLPVTDNQGAVHYLAHGKDPNYPEWADTLQLNIAIPEVQEEMGKVMLELVNHADGIRCDMAMLLNPSTFLRTWGWTLTHQQKEYISRNSFWEKQLKLVKAKAQKLGKEFDVAGEIYWDKDDLGKVFDGIYDNDLYKLFLDVSRGGNIQNLRSHIEHLLRARKGGQRFRDWLYVENHDEERGSRQFGKLSKAFAVLAGIIPDSVFMVNQGQERGSKIRPPMQIGRFPKEKTDQDTRKFYNKLLELKNSRLFQQGEWKMATIFTHNPNLIALEVRSPDKKICAIICVNPSQNSAQCSIPEITVKKSVTVISLTDPVKINPDQIRTNGLFVELKPGEVQIVYFDTGDSQINTKTYSRQNLIAMN